MVRDLMWREKKVRNERFGFKRFVQILAECYELSVTRSLGGLCALIYVLSLQYQTVKSDVMGQCTEEERGRRKIIKRKD